MTQTEIRYANEPVPQPGAIRVLMQGGQWLAPENERPADWRSLMEPKPYAAAPRDVPVIPGQLRQPQAPRPVAQPKRAARPKQPRAPRAPKPPKVAQRRGGYRIASLTIDLILGWQREGLTVAQMVERSGQKLQTINDRMAEARKHNPEYVAAYRTMRSCVCGRSKQVRNVMCAYCKKLARKRAANAARKAVAV